MMNKKPLLQWGGFFLLFSFLFFVFTFWLSRYVESDGGSRWSSGGKIALVRVEGIIVDSKETTEALRRYANDNDIRAILLRVDSPGGGVVPSQEIYAEVKKIRDEGKKKVVVSMGTVAASGGYYIASASNRIIANSGTLTGSLGVIIELANIEGLMQKIGVESIVIKSGANKDIGSPFRKMKEEERALLQNVLDDMHHQFINAVSEGRSLSVETVRPLADGRIFTGRQAKDLGLIDELGGFEYAVRKTADLAGIKGEPHIVEAKRKISLLDVFREISSIMKWERYSSPIRSIQTSYLLSF